MFEWVHDGSDLRGLLGCRTHERFDIRCLDCWWRIVRTMPVKQAYYGAPPTALTTRTFPHRRREPNERAPGTCKVCANLITGKHHHPVHHACSELWMVMQAMTDPLLAVASTLNGRVCAECKSPVSITRRQARYAKNGPKAHADHIIPLWRADRRDPQHWRLWAAPNIQLLCPPCHKLKTGRESAERAASRWP